MRLNYSDEEDFAGQFELWRCNLRRSLHGKNGQAVLRELEAALVGLPEKRLIEGDLANDQGEVCAVGALLAARRCAQGMKRPTAIEDMRHQIFDLKTEEFAAGEGVPRLVAWRLVELNDMDMEGATPEVRYERILTWVRGCLAGTVNE